MISNDDKSKKIRELFFNNSKSQTLYNKNIYFKTNTQVETQDEVSKLISNIISTLGTKSVKREIIPENKNTINLNVNISHNYYNSNVQYLVKNNINEQSIRNDEINKTKASSNTASRLDSGVTKGLVVNQNDSKISYFVPCINCNNIIHLDDIESHSNMCVNVKDEVKKVESSNFSYHSIDYKLRKLKENLSKIQNPEEKSYAKVDFSKDSHYIIQIDKYLEDSIMLSSIHLNTLNSLKKIITNLNTIISTFKGTFSTLILIERARVILLEKLNILKEDLKKLYEQKKEDRNSSKLIELEQRKKKILDEKTQIENEKEFVQRKVINFKSSLKENLMEKPEKEKEKENDNLNLSELENEELIKKNSDKYQVEEINSDFEQKSLKDEHSDNTSMASDSCISDGEDKRKDKKGGNILNTKIDPKQMYKDFVKVFLKVRFEELANDHPGQKIPQMSIWKEVVKREIVKSEWPGFIFNELKNYGKYINSKKGGNKGRLSNKEMDVIKEEL